MTIADRWLLPDGIEELLPAEAGRAERLRRRLLDLYHSWGYQLVMPPLIEYTESLLVGLGSDLDLATFKVTDQLTGRALGVRADITPQVARIDAHSLQQDGPVRLCYAGSVLHTRPKNLRASRSPIQIGAELYGDPGLASDVEVILLMLETLTAAGLEDLTLDLGHIGVFRALVAQAGLSTELEAGLFEALQRKAPGEVDSLLQETGIAAPLAGWLRALVALHGGVEVLEQARQQLAGAPEEVQDAIATLQDVARRVARRRPDVALYFDLGELRGYHYHTGLVFAALVRGWGQAVANGGRYDHIGEVFGRARPATGFNTDLKALISLSRVVEAPAPGAILAPDADDPELWQLISRLREAGEQVISALPGQPFVAGCDRRIERTPGGWELLPCAASADAS